MMIWPGKIAFQNVVTLILPTIVHDPDSHNVLEDLLLHIIRDWR